MHFLFNRAEFLDIIRNYNLAFRPLPIVASALGIAAWLPAVFKIKYSGRIISAILAFFWLWTGAVFNLAYFRPFYSLAVVFAVLFIIQGIVFVAAAAGKPELSFRFKANPRCIVGLIMALYALAGYPLLETLWGRGYPRTLSFGLVPCPTTLFTLALLLLADGKIRWTVFAIPLAYSFAGVVPIASGIYEDIGLLAGGLIAVFFLLRRGKARPENARIEPA